MKKVLISCVILVASALSVQSFAQQAPTGGDKAYNIFYAQDIPYTAVKEQDNKLVALDKQFKAYEAAMNKNDSKKAAAAKTSIETWKSQNLSWVNQLEPHLVTGINNWIESATKSLRLNDPVK
ncbi:MAG: hypothetical protein JNM21_15540 [Taibaiella sp.]|nr:hypothetical protein [Taibaiella sp.]